MSTTPNMILTIDVPLVTPGPDWAADVVANFQLIDLHDHTAGAGVQVPVAGLNINGDLPINSHNINALRTLRLDNQTSTPSGVGDIRIIYSKNGELAYRDAVGNEVVITNMGSIAGATGTISGLVSPASAVYSSITKSLTVNEDTSKPAKLNISEISIYEFDNATANPVTLASPAALAAPYTFTLPAALPSKQAAMLFNTDGSVSDVESDPSVALYPLRVNGAGNGWEAGLVETSAIAPLAVDTARIADQAVTPGKIQNNSITSSQIAVAGIDYPSVVFRNATSVPSVPGEILYTTTSGAFSATATGGTPVQITNLSGSVYNRTSALVKIEMVPIGASSEVFDSGSTGPTFHLFRDGVEIQSQLFPYGGGGSVSIPNLSFVDKPGTVGPHTYAIKVTTAGTVSVFGMCMVAYEI